MMIPIVGPFGLEAAVIIHHAHMGALAPRAELLCGIDCEDDRLVAARAGTVFAIFDLDHPYVLVAYNIVSNIRHDHLHENWRRARTADGDLVPPALAAKRGLRKLDRGKRRLFPDRSEAGIVSFACVPTSARAMHLSVSFVTFDAEARSPPQDRWGKAS